MANQKKCRSSAHNYRPATHKWYDEDLCCDCYHYRIPTSGVTNTWSIDEWNEWRANCKKDYWSCPERKQYEKTK